MNTNEAIWIEWYREETSKSISQKLGKSIDLLCRNRLITQVIIELIKEEIANDIGVDRIPEEILSNKTRTYLKSLGLKEEDQNEETIKKRLNLLYIDAYQMRQQCQIEAGVHEWSRQQWERDIPAMYLEKKDKFDIATYRIMRFDKEKYKLSNEIYHRIKNNEMSFKEACMIHGTEQDKLNRGRPLSQSMNEINQYIKARLTSMKPGQLSRPFEIPDWFIMIELLDLKTSILDEKVKEALIEQRLVSFLKFGAIKVAASLQTDITTS